MGLLVPRNGPVDMAEYHIPVRKYHWTHQNTVVESPVLCLDPPPSALIVRPLEGLNEKEPRILSDASGLRDDIRGGEYATEAHGVLVSTDTQTKRFPVWVPVHSYRCKEDEVYVVNLTTFEVSTTPVAQVCWVAGFEAPDRSLYTVIGAPRDTLRATRVLVLVQQLGLPGKARLALVDPSELATFDEIGPVQKKALFELQLRAILARTNSPLLMLSDVLRVFSSPYKFERGRRALDEILDEDLGVSRGLPSNYSSGDSFDGLSDDDLSDDDSSYDKLTYAGLVESPSSSYSCDCKYALLCPTYYDPRPSHRHGTDDECALGRAHAKHCIFADHSPGECVISGEAHEHCVHPSSEFGLESEFEKLFGVSCLADADALLEWMGSTDSSAYGQSDAEPAPADSPPSIDSHQDPDAESMIVGYRPGAMGSLDALFQGPVWGARMDFGACSSPEPPDLLF
ncbi:hypothetical protein GGS23DRAFT_177560 [Durotheca rogersii]|uniref:uncharacterized protein n=1 Tax=Durotheca rogersii TaxID=419775 RepID=UPI002220072F|nr:uncharacterized protein GGS23DRAFT_177560 [Durotheca rogersii]KAI5867428.1 hypothetical protein GGS23DRAFT_177560 [Durotheca rogersii]